jgi:hypothetical protein
MKNQVIHQTSKIVVIATGLDRLSNNRKTGNMIQIWIMNTNINPVEAVATGIDAITVCKGCPFASGNGCYVNVGQAPLAIWKAFKAGKYPTLPPKDYARAFGGRKVRFGAYGNPSMMPLSIVKAIAKVCNGWTGYFHDWHTMPTAKADAYAQYFMVSTDTEESRLCAEENEWRYFHVSPTQPANTMECLSDAKGMTCADCKLCAGLSKARQKSIWINPHGSKKAKAVKASQG